MTNKGFRDNYSDRLSQIFQDLDNNIFQDLKNKLFETVEKSFSEKIKNPTRVEEMKEYIERVLEFAKGENKEYGAFLDKKLKNTKMNFKTENDLEWGNAKFSILIKNNYFPIKSEYTYGKDKKTVEELINDAKRVLEYAKNLNPEYYKLLINDLLFFDQDKLYNNWYYINRLATYSLEIKEKQGIDPTIDQLIIGPYVEAYSYYLLAGFTDSEKQELFEKKSGSGITDSAIIDNGNQAEVIIEGNDSPWCFTYAKDIKPGCFTNAEDIKKIKVLVKSED